MIIRPLIISIYDNMNELLRLHESYLPIEKMYELREILFSAPQTLNPARMMPMRRMRDKNCLGNSAKLHPTNGGRPGVTPRCQAAFSGQNKYLNNLYRSEVEIPSKKKHGHKNQQPALLTVDV